jgi:hypothetical protein
MGDKQTKSNSYTNSNTNAVSDYAPWASTRPQLEQVLGQVGGQVQNAQLTGNEQGAISGLVGNAQAGNPYAAGIGNLATDLLSGGQDRTGIAQSGYDQYRAGLQPYATGSTNPWDNADFGRVINDVTSRTMDAVKSSYQGAGIPAASYGDFGKTAGEGITSAVAPLAWQASNDLNNRKLGAMDSLYSGANTTAGLLSGLDTASLNNRQAGVGVADAASKAQNLPHMQTIAAEALRRGIPAEALQQISSLLIPMAQLGGTRNVQSNTAGSSYGTQTETPGLYDWMKLGAGSLAGGGNSAMSGLLGFLSDRNEKTDIKKVGTDKTTGLGLYSYRYKGDPKTYPKVVGPMAQDIEKKFPGSTVRIDGKLAVKPEAAGLLGAF